MKYSHKILSPATFYNNVNINKTCTVKQIIEQTGEEKESHNYRVFYIEGKTKLGKLYECELDLSETIAGFYCLNRIDYISGSAKAIYTREGISVEHSESVKNVSLDLETQKFTCSVKRTSSLTEKEKEFLGGDDNIEIGVSVVVKLDFIEMIADITPSYNNKVSLFGAGGILRDIENRLDAIHESLKGIGAKNNIYEPKITELNVNKATVQDVILPKEIYNEETTSLNEILKDIDTRLTIRENAPYQTGYIYGDLEYWAESNNQYDKKIGTVCIYDDSIICGLIWDADTIQTNNGLETDYHIYYLSNIKFSIELPPPSGDISFSWISDKEEGIYITNISIKKGDDNKVYTSVGKFVDGYAKNIDYTRRYAYFVYSLKSGCDINTML